MEADVDTVLKYVREDLRICDGNLMPHRTDHTVVTAMVHEDWLNELLRESKIPDTFPSENSELKACKCISIQVLSKGNGTVSMFKKFHRPLTVQPRNEDLDLDYSNLIHYVTETNFKNLWKDVAKKYNRSALHERRDDKQTLDDALREGLLRIYACPLIDGQRNTQFDQRGSKHGNILKAHCIIELNRAFYILNEHIAHTLHDCITFSPALFNSSFSKPLFVIYQLLQVMRDLHDRGTFLGDLSLTNVYLDQNLWVFVRPCIHDALVRETKSDKPTKRPTSTSTASALPSPSPIPSPPSCGRLSALVDDWVQGKTTNLDYLMELNRLAGRRMGDADHHPVLPWVMDLSCAHGGWRDLTKSKYRLNKGDKQLDLTYETLAADDDDSSHVAHHVSDVLTDITYYVYMARRTARAVLCRHVRPNWVPAEYPSSIQRMQQWTPDECIPQFYTDPRVFESTHDDLPDLEVPAWAENALDFVHKHRAALESDYVSERLNTWIDLTFGYRLTGTAAVKSKNVFLNLVDQHTHLSNCGVNQIFTQPHPQRLNLALFKTPPKLKHFHKDSRRKEKLTDEGSNKEKEKENETSDEPKRHKSISARSRSQLSSSEQTIYLPKDYNPLAALNQLEATYNMTAKCTFQVPLVRDAEHNATGNILHQRKIRDLLSLGCLIVELFLPSRFRLLGSQTELEERFELLRRILKIDSFELPRCVKSVVRLLLHLHLHPNSSDPPSLPLRHSPITDFGLPPPSPHQLLQPLVKLFAFPAYFKRIYAFLSQITLNSSTDDQQTVATARRLVHMMPQLSREGIDIVIPYLQDMFADERTDVLAACCLFEPLAQALGPARTKKQLLTYLVPIYDRDTFTPGCLRLFQRSFLLQLMVRLGVRTFLSHFVTRLIEAVGGFKDYDKGRGGGNGFRRKASHLHSPELEAMHDESVTVLSPFDDHVEKTEPADDGDYEPEPEMFLFDPVPEDVNADQSSESENTSLEDEATVNDEAEAEAEAPPPPPPLPLLDCFGENSSSSLCFTSDEINVSDVATENVDWLSHRLGPVLTAKYLSRNLLRMLSLCYHGGEQLVFVECDKDVDGDGDGDGAGICNKKVAGDTNVANVLLCLSNIAVLYGEQFILVQYLSHIVDLVSCCAKRLTVNLEAGVIGSMMLLKHIVPFVSDAALMDNLQDVLIRDILYPAVQLISSCRLSFPNGAQARRVIAFKLVDVLHLIGLRLGFEMTRKHLTPILRRFFKSFDHIPNDDENSLALHERTQTFDAEMAYVSYIPFCKLAGDIHMEKCLENDALIRHLCTCHDRELLQIETSKNDDRSVSPSSKYPNYAEEEPIVSGTFGKNVAMVGNRIDIRVHEEKQNRAPEVRNKSGKNTNNNNNKMHNNNARHLRGSWLAYWEHEIGQHEKDVEFNFKQIKLQTFGGHTANVRSVCCLDNEISFMTGSKDKSVKLWSLRSHGDGSGRSSCQWTYRKHKKSVFAVAFLDSLRRVVSCDGTVHLWDPFVGAPLRQMEPVRNSCVSVLACLPSPSSVLVTAASDSNLRFFDVRSMRYIHEYKVSVAPAGLIRCVSVSPDGHWLCVGHSSGVISILDVRTGLISAIWKGHEGEILKIRAYNKNTFVTSSLDQHVSVWNADDGKLQHNLRGPTEPVHCFDFYRNEMVSASTANRIGVHTAIDNQASFSSTRLRSDTFRGMISALAILPLNRLLLLGADNGNISLLC